MLLDIAEATAVVHVDGVENLPLARGHRLDPLPALQAKCLECEDVRRVGHRHLERIVRQLGEAAFVRSQDTRRIKNPDMIGDFIALQWHLWDSISTIKEPLAGMEPGQHWQVRQWIPWPAPIPNLPARLTTYTLDSFIDEDNQPKKAVIKSTYELADAANQPYPRPYEGSFQMRGLMGFLRNYNFLSLDGNGTQIFDVEKGLIESDQQHYTLNVTAAFLLPLGDSQPVLTIDQKISIEQIPTP